MAKILTHHEFIGADPRNSGELLGTMASYGFYNGTVGARGRTSTRRMRFDLGLGVIDSAVFMVNYTPNASANGVRLVSCADDLTGVTQIAAFENDATATPVYKSVDVTSDLQSLVAAGVLKRLGVQWKYPTTAPQWFSTTLVIVWSSGRIQASTHIYSPEPNGSPYNVPLTNTSGAWVSHADRVEALTKRIYFSDSLAEAVYAGVVGIWGPGGQSSAGARLVRLDADFTNPIALATFEGQTDANPREDISDITSAWNTLRSGGVDKQLHVQGKIGATGTTTLQQMEFILVIDIGAGGPPPPASPYLYIMD